VCIPQAKRTSKSHKYVPWIGNQIISNWGSCSWCSLWFLLLTDFIVKSKKCGTSDYVKQLVHVLYRIVS
jgi:hypothetical protein